MMWIGALRKPYLSLSPLILFLVLHLGLTTLFPIIQLGTHKLIHGARVSLHLSFLTESHSKFALSRKRCFSGKLGGSNFLLKCFSCGTPFASLNHGYGCLLISPVYGSLICVVCISKATAMTLYSLSPSLSQVSQLHNPLAGK